MDNLDTFKRPSTAFEVAAAAEDLESFGYALRDWQHELKKVSSRPQLADCLGQAPVLMRERFSDGDIADAYLAGYVDFLADATKVERPTWTSDPQRIARNPWFSSPDRKRLLLLSPVPMREKNIFAEPENLVNLQRGRPKVSLKQKKEKNRLRQQRHRARVKKQLAEFRQLQSKD